MIKPDHIPDAVADSMREFFHTRGDAQKAIAAALSAWPGMRQLQENDSASIREMAALILPLPQENSDDQ